jgi:hypothetical protein
VTDGPLADVQFGGDLGVCPSPGQEGEQPPFPGAQPRQARRFRGRLRGRYGVDVAEYFPGGLQQAALA